MTGNWIHIILVLVTAIQQIVGGVSCCCFVSVLLGGSSGVVIARSSELVAAPRTARACCSKSKTGSARVQDRRVQDQRCKVDFAQKLSGDLCECRLARQYSKTEEPLTECQRRNPRDFYSDVGWSTTIGFPWECMAIRSAVDSAVLASKLSHEPAPSALGKRLALKSCWNI